MMAGAKSCVGIMYMARVSRGIFVNSHITGRTKPAKYADVAT